jgi:imidazolonepropionase-like amidohydrolase
MPLFRHFTDETLGVMKQGMERGQEIVRRLDQAGVRLHLGTDTAAMPFTVPGESLHREFRLMIQAGLTLEAAWRAGTSAAGKSLGLSRLGVVQVGAPADLLIFDQDPTTDRAALSTLKGVVAAGRYYSKAFLDEAILRHRERFERPAHEKFTLALIRLSLKLMASK